MIQSYWTYYKTTFDIWKISFGKEFEFLPWKTKIWPAQIDGRFILVLQKFTTQRLFSYYMLYWRDCGVMALIRRASDRLIQVSTRTPALETFLNLWYQKSTELEGCPNLLVCYSPISLKETFCKLYEHHNF